MGRGYFTREPRHNSGDWCTFQIGQCRIHVDLKSTAAFYAARPGILENCICNYCQYFENTVIRQPNRLFEVLGNMHVDLSRPPEGIDCAGETKPGKLGYSGNYFVFGEIGKTSKKSAQMNEDYTVREVIFNDAEFGANTQVTIRQVEENKIAFQFYIEIEKNIEFDPGIKHGYS